MNKNKIVEIIKSVIESALLGLIIALLIVNFVFISVVVQGSSMEPCLEENQKGISFIIGKVFGINRFDIVVIENDENEKLLVKRVIGLPNEKVEFRDNKLYINDEIVAEDFLKEGTVTENLEIILDEDEYFCLGDHREVSKDSRYYGPFTTKQIVSKGIFVFYPLNEIGIKR